MRFQGRFVEKRDRIGVDDRDPRVRWVYGQRRGGCPAVEVLVKHHAAGAAEVGGTPSPDETAALERAFRRIDRAARAAPTGD